MVVGRVGIEPTMNRRPTIPIALSPNVRHERRSQPGEACRSTSVRWSCVIGCCAISRAGASRAKGPRAGSAAHPCDPRRIAHRLLGHARARAQPAAHRDPCQRPGGAALLVSRPARPFGDSLDPGGNRRRGQARRRELIHHVRLLMKRGEETFANSQCRRFAVMRRSRIRGSAGATLGRPAWVGRQRHVGVSAALHHSPR